MASYTYVNLKIIREKLGVREDDVDRVIGESVAYCSEMLRRKRGFQYALVL